MVVGCSVISDILDWSKSDRGENADSGAFGLAGSLADRGNRDVLLAQPVNRSMEQKMTFNIRAIIVIPS